MTISLERAYFLLSVVEKAGSHNYIRAEALSQLAEMDKECAEVIKKRDEVRAEEARKADEARIRAADEAKEAEAKEELKQADAERRAPDPRLERPAPVVKTTEPEVDKASASEPTIERRG